MLIGLVLGLAFGVYRYTQEPAHAFDASGGYWTTKVNLYVTLPDGINGSAAVIYVKNLNSVFHSPEITDALMQKYPQDKITVAEKTGTEAVMQGSFVVAISPISDSSVFTFQADADTEAKSRDVLDTAMQAAIRQARNIAPGFTYWTSRPVVQQQVISLLTGVKSILLFGLSASALAFSLAAGMYGLYYLFSDFITNGETLALLTGKKLLGELDSRGNGKRYTAKPTAVCNLRTVSSLKKLLEQKKAIVLAPADLRSDITDAVRDLSGSLGDARIVIANESDNEENILSSLEDGKPCLIVSPSIIHSQLSSMLAARVGSLAVAAVYNTTRLRDITATQAWVDSAGVEVAGYLFICRK